MLLLPLFLLYLPISYSKDSGLTFLSAFKRELYEIKPEINDFFEKMSKADIGKYSDGWGKLAEKMEITDEVLINFLNDSKQVDKSMPAFEKYANNLNTLGIKAKFASIGMKALNVAMNMAAMWAVGQVIGIVVNSIDKMTNAQQYAMEKSEQLTETYIQETSKLEANITKYKELKEQLESNTLTTEGVISSKKELKKIQDSLISRYDLEASGIDLVNGKYDEQIKKLERLSVDKARDFVAENKTGIEEDKKYLDEKHYDRISGFRGFDFSDKLKDFLSNYEGIKITEMSSATAPWFTDVGNLQVFLDGLSTEDAYDKLSKLYHDIDKKFGKGEEAEQLKKRISSLMTESFDNIKIEDAKKRIEEYAQSQIIADDSLRPLYSESVSLMGKREEAIAKNESTAEVDSKISSLKNKVSDELKTYGKDDRKAFQFIFDGVLNTDSIEESVEEIKDEIESEGEISLKLGLTTNNKEIISGLSSELESLKSLMYQLQNEGLKTSDILSLMTKYSDFDWAVTGIIDLDTGKITTDTETINNAIRKLSAQLLSTATESCPELEQALHSVFNGVIHGDNVVAEAKKVENSIKELESVISQQNKSQVLTLDKTSELIAKYPELANSIIKVANGYIIEGNALNDLIRTKGTEANRNIANEINQTNQVINAVKNRVKAYEADANAYIKSIKSKQYASMEEAKALYTKYMSTGAWDAGARYERDYGKGSWAALQKSVTKSVTYDLEKINLSNLNSYIKQLNSLKSSYSSIGTSVAKANKAVSSGGSSSSSSSSSSKTVFDWIEVKIESISKATDNLKQKIGSFWSYLNNNKQIDSSIKSIRSEIKANETAISKYNSKANSLGLSTSWKNKIKSGSYSIDSITNENTIKKIQEYQEYWDKIQNAKDNVSRLKLEEKELHKQRLDNIKDYYDKLNTRRAANVNYQQSVIDSKTDRGFSITSTNFINDVKSLKNLQNVQLAMLKEERSKYNSNLNSLYNSGKINYETYYEGLIYVKELDTEILKLNADIVATQRTIDEVNWKRLEYSSDRIDNSIDQRRDEIDLIIKKGAKIQESDYRRLLDLYNNSLNNIKSQISEIEKLRSATSVNSELYLGYTNQIESLQSKNRTLQSTIIDVKAEMYDEIWWKPLQKANEEMKKLGNTYKSLADLIDDDAIFDTKGSVTQIGATKISLLASEIESSTELVEKYIKDMQVLEGRRLTYTNKDDFQADMENLNDGLVSEISNLKSLKDSITKMYTDRGKIEIDNLKEIFDLRKKSLQAKKDYYDYDKNIKSKNKNIEALQAELQALENVTSAEDLARKAKLQAQLSDAQEDMKDTVLEHKISVITSGMDDFITDVQGTYDKQVEELKSNLEKQSDIVESITEQYGEFGVSTTIAISNLLKTIGGEGADLSGILGAHHSSLGSSIPNAQKGDVKLSSVSLIGVNEIYKYLTDMYKLDENAKKNILESIVTNYSDRLITVGVLARSNYAKEAEGKIGNTNVNLVIDSLLRVDGNLDKNILNDTLVQSKSIGSSLASEISKQLGVK